MPPTHGAPPCPPKERAEPEVAAAPLAAEGASFGRGEGGAINAIVGANLRRLRGEHALSLGQLSARCGVSRAMICQIERGRSTPTLKLLWKIARSLGAPLSAFLFTTPVPQAFVLRGRRAKREPWAGASRSWRALGPPDEGGPVRLYELRLAPGAAGVADDQPEGRCESLIVTEGALTLRVCDEEYQLEAGDAVSFGAEGPSGYHNPSDLPATMYLVVTCGERPGG